MAEALALGEALGALPPRLSCVTVDVAATRSSVDVAATRSSVDVAATRSSVDVAATRDPHGCLSPAVAAAVEPACRTVRALLAE